MVPDLPVSTPEPTHSLAGERDPVSGVPTTPLVVQRLATTTEDNTSQPPTVLAGLARWRNNRTWQIIRSSSLFPRPCATECPSASFHDDVVFPCLTTPAPSAEGRNPPDKRRRAESSETLQRWAAASRQYPPHQYREQDPGPVADPGRHDMRVASRFAKGSAHPTRTPALREVQVQDAGKRLASAHSQIHPVCVAG